MQVQPVGMLRGAVRCRPCSASCRRVERTGNGNGVGRRRERERELGVDKGLAWALSFFPRQFED